VAEEIALLDNLSNGRMVAGFIRGGFLEHYAYSIDLAESRLRFEEAWRLILRAWTEDEPFEWHGPYYHYDAVSILPRPVQQPHPPLLMAGHTRESVEWAARERVPLAASFGATEVLARTFAYYREYAARECGWTPGPEHCLVSRQVYVGKTNAEARAEAEEHVLTFYRESPVIRPLEGKLAELRAANLTTRSASHYEGRPGAEGGRTGEAGSAGTREAAAGPPAAPEITFERFQREGYCIIGDPDYVAAEMRRQAAVMGVGTFMLYSPFATLPVAQATRSLELFAREVLPAVREETAQTPGTAGYIRARS
jgi:alkanesulfonate monooxygenase SsuD/methylene tetrahydromethanopterin reductase-like flavin-dependent oxidoreductase (luciferase family)